MDREAGLAIPAIRRKKRKRLMRVDVVRVAVTGTNQEQALEAIIWERVKPLAIRSRQPREKNTAERIRGTLRREVAGQVLGTRTSSPRFTVVKQLIEAWRQDGESASEVGERAHLTNSLMSSRLAANSQATELPNSLSGDTVKWVGQ
jgi:hypothetical protein